MRAALLAGLALLAAGCAPTYPVVANAPAATPAPAPQVQRPGAGRTPETQAPPPRSPLPQSPAQLGAQSGAQRRDQCGAADLQNLVGRPRTEIPVPLDPRRQRVACTTCPMTDDVDPTRLNFLFDAQSGRIRQVRCG